MAAWRDYKEYRVKNRLILAGWSMGILSGIYYYGLTGAICSLFNISISVLVLFVFFRFRMMGAGDIKLLSVVSGFMGFSFTVRVLIVSVFIGGILSLLKCIQYGYLINRMSYFRHYISELLINKRRIPYYVRERDGYTVVIPFSLAIAIGYLVVISGVAEMIRV